MVPFVGLAFKSFLPVPSSKVVEVHILKCRSAHAHKSQRKHCSYGSSSRHDHADDARQLRVSLPHPTEGVCTVSCRPQVSAAWLRASGRLCICLVNEGGLSPQIRRGRRVGSEGVYRAGRNRCVHDCHDSHSVSAQQEVVGRQLDSCRVSLHAASAWYHSMRPHFHLAFVLPSS